MSEPLLTAEGLVKAFGTGRHTFRAVDDVSLDIHPGESVGLVGESGSGKSTFARLLNGLIRPDAGRLYFRGSELTRATPSEWRKHRKHIQMIFQDPYACLNPRLTIRRILEEPLRVHRVPKADRERRIRHMLDAVQLPQSVLNRHPHQFSGGQRQRIGIARALLTKPDLVLADEPVAALDVSVQAQVLRLIRDLQRDLGCALLFIAHDLAVVKTACDRVAVMRAGTIVESRTTEDLFTDPRTDYTRELLDAVPSIPAETE